MLRHKSRHSTDHTNPLTKRKSDDGSGASTIEHSYVRRNYYSRDTGHEGRDAGHEGRDTGHKGRDAGHEDRNAGHEDRDAGHEDRDESRGTGH